MKKTVFINLSALAAPEVSGDFIPTYILNMFDKNLALQWPSLVAFAKLRGQFDPTAQDSTTCFGLFSVPFNDLYWVKEHLDWALINKYKLGNITTDQFLNELLNNHFSFITKAHLGYGIKQQVMKNKENFLSLRHLDEGATPSDTQIAKALLEQAWCARMTFNKDTDHFVKDFFERHQEDNICVITNSNEMDLNCNMLYLSKLCPSLPWLKTTELQENIKTPEKETPIAGISLTKTKAITLYASYIHRTSKTAGTPTLFDLAFTQEKINRNDTLVITQWKPDGETAILSGIPKENVMTPRESLLLENDELKKRN